MQNELVKIVENGEKTKFWEDQWVSEGALKNKFSRLFRVSEQREARVCEMGH